MAITLLLLAALTITLSAGSSQAEIQFEEATAAAGISYRGPSWGVSWGDFDGDGWPDAWISNHLDFPSLYQNNRDGAFTDIAHSVWTGQVDADTHGAAWADYDNDGDQDLLELSGGQVGTSVYDDPRFISYLYRNEGGNLRAVDAGLAYPLGRGRTPVWFDYDHDGRLDVVLTSVPRPDGKAPIPLLRQEANGQFIDVSEPTGFRRSEWLPRVAAALGLQGTTIWQKIAYRMRYPAEAFSEYGQLSDLMGDGLLHLILHGTPYPYRILRIEQGKFQDRTTAYDLPAIDNVQDSAIADLNGDLLPDIFVARAAGPYTPEALLIKPTDLRAFLKDSATGIRFSAQGAVQFSLSVKTREALPEAAAVTEVYIGKNGRHPETTPFMLATTESLAQGMSAGSSPGIYLGYDVQTALWSVNFLSQGRGNNLTAEITAANPIEKLQTVGFENQDPALENLLFINTGNSFKDMTRQAGLDLASSCNSVVAADFDNDMDLDLYLVCSRTTANLPNRLFENQGSGRFRLIENAGGASGAQTGRGDSVAAADYDLDGFVDLFVTNGQWIAFSQDGPHQLFHNRGNANHWLEIDLAGVQSNRDAIGAKVFVRAGGATQLREQMGGMHRYSQNHTRLHFGLGPNPVAELLQVVWPNGKSQEFQNIPANRIIKITEGDNVLGDLTPQR